MNNTTITFHGRQYKSMDSLIFKNINWYPEYKVAYICKNEEDIKTKIDLFKNFKENFKDIFTRNFIKQTIKDGIIFENGSTIRFSIIDRVSCTCCGSSYDALVIEDAKTFKEKFPEQYDDALKGIIPCLAASDKEGMLISIDN